METIALEIEIRTYRKRKVLCFDRSMLDVVISGLSAVYKEAFVWLVGNHLMIWVVGNSSEFLVNAFIHHSDSYKKISLVSGTDADKLFDNIVQGKMWGDCSLMIKFHTLQRAYELSTGLHCLSAILHPMVSRGLTLFNDYLLNAGIRNV